jgi:hypothetical protein
MHVSTYLNNLIIGLSFLETSSEEAASSNAIKKEAGYLFHLNLMIF